jgi:hypothetical protein
VLLLLSSLESRKWLMEDGVRRGVAWRGAARRQVPHIT